MYNPADDTSGSNFESTAQALWQFATVTGDAVETIVKTMKIRIDLIAACIPPEPAEVKLVLPHKKQLVARQQEAKRREQLRVWGLRK